VRAKRRVYGEFGLDLTDNNKTFGLVGVVVSLKDLSSSNKGCLWYPRMAGKTRKMRQFASD